MKTSVTTNHRPVEPPVAPTTTTGPSTIALIGNPNCGKTTLFNGLTGLRAKTANFPGTTIEKRVGRLDLEGRPVELLDLPGLYSLTASSAEERVALDALVGRQLEQDKPQVAILIADALNLNRSLFLACQALEHRIPLIVALNMIDLARDNGITIDVDQLAAELGCPVVPIVARKGEGLAELKQVLRQVLANPEEFICIPPPLEACEACGGCPFRNRYAWSEGVTARVLRRTTAVRPGRTERIDRVLTHPVVGVLAFLSVMLGVFFLIFEFATIPMDLIDGLFSKLGVAVGQWLPAGTLRSLVVEGIIGGVGGMLVFLPQICILFFCLSLLEDTGYLARAAFVMDRLMKRVGLPGKAFVPLLSAHACAIPAIMSTRVIENWRDRLVTILVAPLVTCSARIPVYSMLAALLFAREPFKAALVFTGAYALGIVAAIGSAFLLKKTILPGRPRPLVLELPSYKLPSLRTALLTTYDRGRVFVQKAGTFILAISVLLWVLSTYPRSEPPAEAARLQAQAAALVAAGEPEQGAALEAQAEKLASRDALSNSAAGRIGRLIEPVLRPLGYDWQIGIGIISSFAAREVIVSTLAVVYGVGADAADEDPGSLYDSLREAQRSDGTPVFTTATSVSLLVFYVLAMQCLPTQAVTKRETNSWKWPAVQLGYMTLLAYGAALIAYRATTWWVGG